MVTLVLYLLLVSLEDILEPDFMMFIIFRLGSKAFDDLLSLFAMTFTILSPILGVEPVIIR